MVTFLLEHTRHTPRDFIMLLNHLKPFYKGRRFERAEVLSGLRDYSIKYFLPEIRDELSGYVGEDVIGSFITAIGMMKKRLFDYTELFDTINDLKTISKYDYEQLLHALYECSAIGNRWRDTMRSPYKYEVKYRNRYSSIKFNQEMTLHQGLWKALNIA